MKYLALFLLLVVTLVHCDPKLNDIIDARLAQFKGDQSLDTDHAGGYPSSYVRFDEAEVEDGSAIKGTVTSGYFYNFKMDVSGIMRNVVRVGDAQVTPMDKGPVVKYVQQESILHFTGFVNFTQDHKDRKGPFSFVPITGHIQLHPISVTLERVGGLFRVTPASERPKGPVKTLTVVGLTRHPLLIEALKSNLDSKFTSPFSPSPFWSKVAPIEVQDHRQETWTWIQKTNWPALEAYLDQQRP
ncbi:hypothetical protein HDE_03658 [Halotydeus destructor]|nr:hypothetical protein HDE_03658 [Halotydeus destructor]